MSESTTLSLTIDHVTVAGPSLTRLEKLFNNLGLTTTYGGPHSNGVTHMSLLGFDDGSYIELISTLESGAKETAFWGEHIAGNAGPCAWAVRVADIAVEAERLAALGVTVDGPYPYHRQRPDGQRIEWELAFLGNKSAGATLPFLIKDITPRALRVQPSASVTTTGEQPPLLTGVARVVLAVKTLDSAIDLFQRVYRWPAPEVFEAGHFGAQLAVFSDTPVILATPLPEHRWLAERLEQFDDAPCAYLLGSSNFNAARQQFECSTPARWLENSISWLAPEQLDSIKIGLIDDST